WSEIQASSKYYVDAPGALFINSNPKALGTVYKRFLSVDGKPQVCVSGNMIYAGTTKACVKVDQNAKTGSGQKCLAYETTALWAPVSGTKTICTKYQDSNNTTCVKTQTISYSFTNLSADIWNKHLRDEDYPQNKSRANGYLGAKAFALPACQAQVVPAN
ncbi:MAG: hypothetical protein KDD22_01200, partial [Bdellovibrionales bacterium]|nr:hypothetical protein [Bdellovibrionales bacterium]